MFVFWLILHWYPISISDWDSPCTIKGGKKKLNAVTNPTRPESTMRTVKGDAKIQDEIIIFFLCGRGGGCCNKTKKKTKQWSIRQSLNCSDSLFCQKTFEKLSYASAPLLRQYLRGGLELDPSVEKQIIIMKAKKKKKGAAESEKWNNAGLLPAAATLSSHWNTGWGHIWWPKKRNKTHTQRHTQWCIWLQ